MNAEHYPSSPQALYQCTSHVDIEIYPHQATPDPHGMVLNIESNLPVLTPANPDAATPPCPMVVEEHVMKSKQSVVGQWSTLVSHMVFSMNLYDLLI